MSSYPISETLVAPSYKMMTRCRNLTTLEVDKIYTLKCLNFNPFSYPSLSCALKALIARRGKQIWLRPQVRRTLYSHQVEPSQSPSCGCECPHHDGGKRQRCPSRNERSCNQRYAFDSTRTADTYSISLSPGDSSATIPYTWLGRLHRQSSWLVYQRQFRSCRYILRTFPGRSDAWKQRIRNWFSEGFSLFSPHLSLYSRSLQGAASFMKKTVFGLSDSFTKFTSSVGKGH